MKKILLSVFALLSIISVNAEYTINDIINDNTKLTEKQQAEKIKKIPTKEKIEMLNSIELPAQNTRQADTLLYFMYKFPKDAFNDKESVESYLNNIYIEMATNGKNLDFYKQRVNNENFNIYYEALMMDFAGPKSTGVLSYPEYDNFYSKLQSGTLDYKKESDRKFFSELNKEMDFSYIEDEDDSENKDKTEVLNQYFKRPEFKNYKIMNKYHMYRLGMEIFKKYNENTAEFISKKINDKNTNLENLCYFMSSLKLKDKVSPLIEKEFDNGYYNPQTDPFKLWRHNKIIDVRDIDGTFNPVIKAINSNNISLTTDYRLEIEYINDLFNPNFSVDYRQKTIDDINQISKDDTINDKTSAVMAVMLKYYNMALKDNDEMQRKNNARLDYLNNQLEDFLKKNPKFRF